VEAELPVKIKIAFSFIVLCVAIAGYFFLAWLGQDISKYLALFLGAFCVFAFWVFPEVTHKKKSSERK
jgi:amino acid permease